MTFYPSIPRTLTTKSCRRVALLTLVTALTASMSACSPPSSSTAEATVATDPGDQALIKHSPVVGHDSQTIAQSAFETNQSNAGLLKNISGTVYKDINCGCCSEWVDYAEGEGMQAKLEHPDDLSLLKVHYGVPQQMRSCHTTVTEDGFVFEGHIPAKYMAQFLANPPKGAIGLAVPSMPVGSPGMEYQGKFLPYKVFQLNKDGSTTVFAEVATKEQQL